MEKHKNPTKSAILQFLSQEKEQFEARFRIAKIGLFGSYALGEETEHSDIDILVEFYPNTENLSEIKSSLKQFIKTAFEKEVNIAREKYLKPYFREQILRSAIII
ncbi:MAG: nucleotidyltransferase domain-containing protein [Saprospiraceae bacterium]|nr:nucleotidyltransferase domain-containing protein [Saprospiraceae bacterium]